MRNLLPVLVAVLAVGAAPMLEGATVERENDPSAVRVQGTTEGGLAAQAGLPGRRASEQKVSLGGQTGQYFLNR